MSTSSKMSDEVKRFLSEMGRRNGMKGDRAKKSQGAKQRWANMSEDQRRELIAKATAASIEARRKKREAKDK